MNKRATKFEKEKRILTVQGWMIEGVQDDFIIRQIITQWGVGQRQAEKYIEQAYKRWKPKQAIEMEARREAMIAELQQDARSLKAEHKGTPQGLNSITRIKKEIIKLRGIRPAKQIEIKTIADMTREEKEARMNELMEIIKKRSIGGN